MTVKTGYQNIFAGNMSFGFLSDTIVYLAFVDRLEPGTDRVGTHWLFGKL